MKDPIKYLLTALVCATVFACTKKDEPANIFKGTLWEAKVNMDTAINKRTHGYRLSFEQDNRYRITELDEDKYTYRTADTGTYKYEDPYLTLTSDRGGDKVLIYHTSPQEKLYAGYYGVNFFKQ